MAEYTYKDVIIDPNDPRVEIGKEYYWGENPRDTIARANDKGGALPLFLVDRDEEHTFPFYFCQGSLEGGSHFLILKKEPKKKYVPFDLSKEEDRARLRGAWVRIKGSQLEHQIVGLAANTQIVFLPDVVSVEAKELLEGYEFFDGTPCGKLVEVG